MRAQHQVWRCECVCVRWVLYNGEYFASTVSGFITRLCHHATRRRQNNHSESCSGGGREQTTHTRSPFGRAQLLFFLAEQRAVRKSASAKMHKYVFFDWLSRNISCTVCSSLMAIGETASGEQHYFFLQLHEFDSPSIMMSGCAKHRGEQKNANNKHINCALPHLAMRDCVHTSSKIRLIFVIQHKHSAEFSMKEKGLYFVKI